MKYNQKVSHVINHNILLCVKELLSISVYPKHELLFQDTTKELCFPRRKAKWLCFYLISHFLLHQTYLRLGLAWAVVLLQCRHGHRVLRELSNKC